ncbi:MAG TPA: alginate export family protein [Pseudomonas xinjiangensis]|uniref:Alginate export family protein n=2 Tax=root TaxID=1 RepID=A0A7V1BQL7_9GAMM|nr:alginate export family protein [Halopseudomonas xinjiangensis]HEC47204.1 alginate export family protein [Halopseudomonas xinjiangensis]
MRTLLSTLSIPALLVVGAMNPAAPAQAQAKAVNPLEQSRPFPGGPSRWLENYRFLEDPAKRTDPLDALRYHRLGDSSWLQLGGELRYAFTSTDNLAFGITGLGDDSYIQQRAQAHASLHLLDNRLRAFVQLQNTRSWNQEFPSPRDESRNDVAQAFIDANFALGQLKTTARLGRQEIQYGQGALFNIGEPPNVRLAFDGARLIFNKPGGYQLDLLALRPVRYDFDNFDDSSDNNTHILGVYASLPLASRSGIDFYGFAREMEERTYQGFIGKEDRYTIGTRLFGNHDGLDWNWDLMMQDGEHANRDIRAWAVRTDSGYTFNSPAQIRLGLHLDVASGGDAQSATTTRTFDALYPRNGTYGEAAVTTMANLILAGPSLSFTPIRTIGVMSSILQTWRESTDDYVYLPGMRPLVATLNNSEREIGTIYQFTARWQPNSNFNIDLHMMHLAAGEAVTKAGGDDVNTVVLRTAMRF